MPVWWRLLGFGGSVLLALAAVAPLTVSVVLWVLGLGAVSWAWLRDGLHWTAFLPLLVVAPLGSSDVYSYACQGWLWINDVDPYTSGVLDGGCPWAAQVPSIWWHTPAPYGPLALAISGLAASTGSLASAVGLLRLAALAGAALLAWQLPRLTACLSPAASVFGSRLSGSGSLSVLALGVLSPLVLIHGVSGAHHDLLMTALAITALAIASPGRLHAPPRPAPTSQAAARSWWHPAVAGILVALAIAIKVTAIVVLPFVLLLLLRERIAAGGSNHPGPADQAIGGAGKAGWLRVTSAVAAAIVTFTGLTLGTGLGLGWAKALGGTGSVTQWSSPPTAVGMTVSYVLRLFGVDSSLPVTIARAVALAALAVIAVVLITQAWQGKRDIIVACGLTVTAMTLLSPVFYPWYAILPVALLALTRQIWLTAAIIGVTALTLPNGDGIPALTKLPGALLVTAALGYWAFRKRRPVRGA